MQVPFRAIGVFHAAARTGSISRAADELGVTPSAVSQQIQSLEFHLGTALMVKMGRGVTLTEAGERFFDMIADAVERIRTWPIGSAVIVRLLRLRSGRHPPSPANGCCRGS